MDVFCQWGTVRWLCCLATLTAAVGVAGCAQPAAYREEGFRSTDLDVARQMRPLGPPGRALGLSQKARDVERNLGVQ